MKTAHKPQTDKYYQEKINLVWLFIQHNLHEKLQLDQLAAIAILSPFHFHRIFTAYTGESVNRYIRRLRLERAATLVLYTDLDITTIGLDNGYETPAAFSRAFKQQFGTTPSLFRKNNNLKFPRKIHKPSIIMDSGLVSGLDYAIVHIKPQRVLYVRTTGNYMQSAFKAWEILLRYAETQNLMDQNTQNFGIPLDSPEVTESQNMRYDACISVTDSVKPNGEFAIQIIKGGRYAVFCHYGAYDKLEQTYNNIILNWLPNTHYQLLDAPAFENYLDSDCLEKNSDQLKTKIYIPLV